MSFAKEFQDECIKVSQNGYSIEQAIMLYEHLMGDNALACTFFGMCEDFRKVWLNKFFTSQDI